MRALSRMYLHRARAPGHPEGITGEGRGIEARPATTADVQRWDELVVATGRPHLLQSAAWAQVKAATGWEVRRFVLEDQGVAQVLLKRLPLGISVAYAPRGPLAAPERIADAIDALRRALASDRCASLLCDPEAPPADGSGARAPGAPGGHAQEDATVRAQGGARGRRHGGDARRRSIPARAAHRGRARPLRHPLARLLRPADVRVRRPRAHDDRARRRR